MINQIVFKYYSVVLVNFSFILFFSFLFILTYPLGLFSNIILLQKNTKEELVQILNEKNKNINKYFDIYKHGIIKVFNFDFSNIDASKSMYIYLTLCISMFVSNFLCL